MVVLNMGEIFKSNVVKCMSCQLPIAHCEMCSNNPPDEEDPIGSPTDGPCSPINIGGPHSWVNNNLPSKPDVFTDEEQEAWNRMWTDTDKPDEHPLRAYRFVIDGV
jgi:hypothetical protein